MRTWILGAALVAVTAGTSACDEKGGDVPVDPAPGITTRVVDYKDGETTLKGYLASNPTISSLRPVVLVFHDWWGQGELARETAKRVAGWGYIGFAVDMYGDAKLVTTPKEAGELAGMCRADGCLVGRRRAKAALDAIATLPFIDQERIAAIGFCFGGTLSLEVAWSGAPVRGVVSFHGSPTLPKEGESTAAEVLVLHGADDTFVPAKALDELEATLIGKKIPYEIVAYSGAVHSFTDPGVDKHGLPGAKYNARAAQRSFARCEAFLREVLVR